MSERNNIFENDPLMRSILESGQEEVPARVWDGVADGLDKAARKTVVLRWRRVALSAAAVAAVVAAVLVLNKPEDDILVPAAVHGDMVAVVEPEAVDVVEPEETDIIGTESGTGLTGQASRTGGTRLMAYMPERNHEERSFEDVPQETYPVVADEARQEAPMDDVTEADMKESADLQGIGSTEEVMEIKEYFPTVWDDEKSSRKVRTSLTVSGITGSSGTRQRTSFNMQKAPALIMSPVKTGIKEKDIPSRYGLPVSVGAGVRFDFTPRWSLGTGLNYTYLSRTFDGTYTHANEAGVIDNLITSDIRNSQHYLGIPVNVYFNIVDSKIVNFYAYAGGAVEKCVYDKYVILSNSIVHKEPVKGVQLSADIGLGVEFMITDYLGLYVDPSLRYYFDCNQPKSIRTDQPLMLGFELGFRFIL